MPAAASAHRADRRDELLAGSPRETGDDHEFHGLALPGRDDCLTVSKTTLSVDASPSWKNIPVQKNGWCWPGAAVAFRGDSQGGGMTVGGGPCGAYVGFNVGKFCVVGSSP